MWTRCQVQAASGNNLDRITSVTGGILIAQGAASDVCTTGDKSDVGNVIGMWVWEGKKNYILRHPLEDLESGNSSVSTPEVFCPERKIESVCKSSERILRSDKA